jgi:hypothetical protein
VGDSSVLCPRRNQTPAHRARLGHAVVAEHDRDNALGRRNVVTARALAEGDRDAETLLERGWIGNVCVATADLTEATRIARLGRTLSATARATVASTMCLVHETTFLLDNDPRGWSDPLYR